MPDRVNSSVAALLVLLGLGAIGCSATCIRDSDCLGASVCSENRCLLVVGRDAGRASSAAQDDVPGEADASALPRDAGN